jgi:hypothetical protein
VKAPSMVVVDVPPAQHDVQIRVPSVEGGRVSAVVQSGRRGQIDCLHHVSGYVLVVGGVARSVFVLS